MMMDVYTQAETCCSKTFQHNWVKIYGFFPYLLFLEPQLDVPNKTNLFIKQTLFLALQVFIRASPPPPPRKT